VNNLVPTSRANGQPAFGAYVSTPTALHRCVRLPVITLSGDRVCALTGFD
jgi:hypothetical protein